MNMKKICVIGAGAIGGLVAVQLKKAGNVVSVIARGPHLAAIQEKGLTLVQADGSSHTEKMDFASTSLAELPKQDVIIIALKAHQIEPLLTEIVSACHADTLIIPMQNGIPFWYFQRNPHLLGTKAADFAGRTVTTVDPKGQLLQHLDATKIIGCVVYPAAVITRPGVVQHVEGWRFPLGELDGTVSARVQDLSACFEQAGLKAPVLDNIRAEIWLKLWGNLSFNPISALTHTTLATICRESESNALVRRLMEEAQAIAEAYGVVFRVDIDRRIAGAEKVGEHKTSMLQDVEAGREPEIDALVGSVLELGGWLSMASPHLHTVYMLVRTLGNTMMRQKIAVKGAALG
ncbi:MAG: hypothetical protein RLZZ502_291 [Pseudomonadota bacterium]|jgi:2-dehydropantoate 2-reductase